MGVAQLRKDLLLFKSWKSRAAAFAVVAAMAAPVVGSVSAAGAAGNGSTVLHAQLPDVSMLPVDGVPTVLQFTCDEHRVQFADGTAKETLSCKLLPGQPTPSKATQAPPGQPFTSDFFINSVPGFSGPFLTHDYHGVLTPSGNLNVTANFAP